MSPQAWLAWAAMVTAIALSVTNPLYLALVLLAVVLVGVMAPAGGSTGLRALAVAGVGVTAFSMLVALINGSPGEHVIFTIPGPAAPSWLGGLRFGGPVTGEGLVAAATRAVAIICVIGAFAIVTSAVTPSALLRTAPAVLFHAGLVVTIGLTMLPATFEDVRRLREAQALRGVEPRWWRLPALIVPSVLGGMERAMGTAEALEARGYGSIAAPHRGGSLAGAAAVPLLLGAAYLRLSGDAHAAVPVALLLLGLGLVGAWAIVASRRNRTTTLRPNRVRLADKLLIGGSLAAAVAVVALSGAGAAGLVYDPFAGLAPPPFTAAGAALALCACWPALRLLNHGRQDETIRGEVVTAP